MVAIPIPKSWGALRQPFTVFVRVVANQIWQSNQSHAANRRGLAHGGEIGEVPIGDRLVGQGPSLLRPRLRSC